jgi:hypothetical protein
MLKTLFEEKFDAVSSMHVAYPLLFVLSSFLLLLSLIVRIKALTFS